MTLAMKGASRQSLAGARALLEKKISSLESAGISKVSTDLLSMVAVFDSNIALSRALTDPSRKTEDKSELVKRVFENGVSETTFAFVKELIALRWSYASDLVRAIERLGVETEAAAAEKDGALDRLESELFAFTQTIQDSSELRAVLADRTVQSTAKKSALIRTLLNGKATESTIRLIGAMVDQPRGRNVEAGMRDLTEAVAARKNRTIVHVKSAIVLSKEQIDRITKSLSAQIGATVRLNVEIDSKILGGLSVRFGDELIDGSIATRIIGAERTLSGQSA
ncbi:MAG: F0F1 ATP synthase subunit delta [Actinobacteria bacterium]|nr:F0F1 ATP synthase subunit delta [Actinomycetota bacterium]